ncbi:MAG: flagellar motor protein [Deltaproteobacteria bacterium]|nr:MAG: flagellar motor protein [Deltaproteobacteria bacterium]
MAEEENNENPFAAAGGQKGSGDEEGGGVPEWMATFADLVTLLMCFFVLLFAMSSTQQETYKELVQSLKSALGVQQLPEAGTREGLDVPPPPPDTEKNEDSGKESEAIDEVGAMVQKELKDIESDVKELIMFNKLGGLVKVQENTDGVVITLSDVMLFPPGEAVMTRRGREVMADLAQVLAQFTYPLKIGGHTDNVPIHTARFASNWELSATRACEVVRFLIDHHIDPRLMTAEGYGEFRPIASNTEGRGRAQNRRVEIRYERYAMAKQLAESGT